MRVSSWMSHTATLSASLGTTASLVSAKIIQFEDLLLGGFHGWALLRTQTYLQSSMRGQTDDRTSHEMAEQFSSWRRSWLPKIPQSQRTLTQFQSCWRSEHQADYEKLLLQASLPYLSSLYCLLKLAHSVNNTIAT